MGSGGPRRSTTISPARAGPGCARRDYPGDVRRRFREDLRAALKSRDEVRVAAHRSVIAAIDNAEAVESGDRSPAATSEHFAGATAGLRSSDVERRRLADEERAIVRAQAEERLTAAQEHARLGRGGQADRLRREASLLLAYLDDEPRR